MNRRFIIAVATAASLAVPTAALATSTAARTGSFDAMGTGTVIAQGKLRVFGTIDGTVVIRDRSGDAVVKIGGIRQQPKRAMLRGQRQIVYRFKNVDGAFFVRGRNIKIELRATDETLSMTAFGRGEVTRLTGEGTYHLNGGGELDWTSALVPIVIDPPQSAPKPTRPGDDARPN